MSRILVVEDEPAILRGLALMGRSFRDPASRAMPVISTCP